MPSILDEISELRPHSKENLKDEINNILSSRLERIIDTHNTTSIIFVFKNAECKLLLKAEYGSGTATHKEISWYESIRDQDPGLGVEYMGGYRGDNHAALLLEFIEGSSTIDELAATNQIESKDASSLIQQAISLDRQLFEGSGVKSSYEAVNSLLINKYNKRRKESRLFPYLEELFSRRFITVNGKKLATPDVIVESIQKTSELSQLLTPTKLGLVHGDLHCGNILVEGKRVALIDPNGNTLMPLEYDIGKMLHSIHGQYGSIMRGDYELVETDPCSFLFTVRSPEAYNAALSDLQAHLSEQEYMRALYIEALHFATMLPHHASVRKETTALFLRCAQLFDELMELVVTLPVSTKNRHYLAGKIGYGNVIIP